MSLPPEDEEDFVVTRKTLRPSQLNRDDEQPSSGPRLPTRPTQSSSWLQEVRDTPVEGEAEFLRPGTVSPQEDEELFPNLSNGRRLPLPGEKDGARYRNKYQSAITFDLVMKTPYSKWAGAEDKVSELTSKIQGILSDQNMAEEIRVARVERNEERDATLKKLETMVLRELQGDRSLGEHKYYIVSRVINEIVGLGPLEPLWENTAITEIIVQGRNRVLVEIHGRKTEVPGIKFRNDAHLRDLAKQILTPLNRSIDTSSPLADGRLPGLSRVNIVHESLSSVGYIVTIRRHKERPWTLKDLVENKVLVPDMADNLGHWIHSGLSTAVIGGTGSGKALCVDTLIPTPQGFVRMGDLKIGDRVFGSDGQATPVLGVYDQGLKTSFRVKFSDGSEIIADADHNWLTYTRAARRAKSRAVKTPRRTPITLEDYQLLKTLLEGKVASSELVTLKELQEVVPAASSLIWRLSYSITPQKKGQHGRKFFDATEVLELLDKKITDFKLDRNAVFGEVVTTREIKETLLTNTNHRNHAVPVLSSPVQWDKPQQLPKETLNTFGSISADIVYADASVRSAYLCNLASHRGASNGDWVTFREDEFSAEEFLTLTTLIESLGMIANRREGAVTYVVTEPVSGRNSARSQFRYIVDVVEEQEQVEMRCISVGATDKLFLCGTQFIPTHNTTVLNALSGLFPVDDIIITIEDNFELHLHPDRFVTGMEARDANSAGRGDISIRMLVKNALRMNPSRIVIGEVRDAAAYDMLQAMNTGHNGSMTTLHANDADASIQRLGDMAGMSGEINPEGVKFLIASSLDLVVVAKKYDEDGSRRIQGIYEVPNQVVRGDNGALELKPVPLWEFVYDSTDEDGKVIGHYEKKNEMSESMIRKYSLTSRPRMSLEEIYQISALVDPNAEDDNADT